MIRREIETQRQRDLRHKRLFQDLDIDDDGDIKPSDLKEAFFKMDHPLKENEEAVRALYAAMDINQTNHVDFSTFDKFATIAESQIEKGFNEIDTNRDGVITPSEISAYITKLHKENSKKPRFVGLKTPTDLSLSNFIEWAFNLKENNHKERSEITYNQWRDFLILIPKREGSRIKTAYGYFYLFKEDVDLSSEGDMTLINDFIDGIGFFFAGGLAGVVSRTCTAPLDRIKVFLIARTDLSSTILNTTEQVLAHNPHANVEKLRSPLIKAIITLYRGGGIRQFYVGNGLNIFKVFPESSIKFGSFEICKQLMAKLEGKGSKSDISQLSTYMAGGLAGMAAQCTSYPIDTLKFRMQCANLHTHVNGNALILRTAKDMYKEGGLKIFYRGISAGLVGIFPYAAIDLGTFTALKSLYTRRTAKAQGILEQDVTISNLAVLPMGAFSGSIGATIVYPINLCRTRLQTQGTFAHPYHYTGFRDVFIQTIRREGYQGLYKGLVPTLAKVCPAVSISYLCYENLKRFFDLEK